MRHFIAFLERELNDQGCQELKNRIQFFSSDYKLKL